jgi:hypothetical protein
VKIISGQLRLSASDAANFLACQHLTRLDLLSARRVLSPPSAFDVGFHDLVARGEAYERIVLGQFRADGRHVAEIEKGTEAEAAVATLQAIGAGADVIYQGVLLSEETKDEPALLGQPDFLVRADLLGAPDDQARPAGIHYEDYSRSACEVT